MGRGEACCSILMQQQADSETGIRSAFAGAAVRQDGRSSSLTAPNGRAQQALILAATMDAGVQPSVYCWVEAHGTVRYAGRTHDCRRCA